MLIVAKYGNYQITDLIKRFMLKSLSNMLTLGLLQISLAAKSQQTEGHLLHENEV
jgi:hypothetical protein